MESSTPSFVLTDNSNGQQLAMHHLAHDLRGPLNSILGFSELLLDGIEGELNEYQQADIMAMYQSAQNLLRLINNVMDLSRLEAHRLNLTIEPIPLAPILEDVLAFNFGSTKPESVRLVGNLPPNLPLILGQRDRVQQMVLGLMRFACKTQTTQVTLTATPDDEFITVQVHTGPEVLATKDLTDIFELQVTVDTTGHSKLSRGGIELPLIRGLAQAHQGEVWAESSPEHGTTFYLKLRRG